MAPFDAAVSMATRLAFWKKEVEDARSDESHATPGALADFILGSQDGLVNVLGVLLGVAIATQQRVTSGAITIGAALTIVYAAGFAATFAESISMGAVAYTSTLARRDHYLKELEREKREMRELPDVERREVREILERWEFSGAELEEMTDKIIAKPKAWLELMMAHELNLAPVEKAQARQSGVLVGVAAIVGSIIPLVPFLILREDLGAGIIASLVVSAITLFLIGWYKAKTTVGRPGRSGLQMLVIGLTAALVGFGIAYLVGVAGI